MQRDASAKIEDLRRRVESNPASLAFGPLAEAYRQAGLIDEAIAACRAGLAHHPNHAAARVSLGRALLDRGDVDAARAEFERAARQAPENLAARRGLDEVLRRLPKPAAPAPVALRAAAMTVVDRHGEAVLAGLERFLRQIVDARHRVH